MAAQFLTIIPLKIKNVDEKKLAVSLIYFPVVGALLGLFLAGIYRAAVILRFQEFISNILPVIALVVLTGGMHLDGLADTFDALLSRRNKEEMLRIMRDPHIGVMGVLSILSVLLLKISFLSSISPVLKTASLVLSCVLSRWLLVVLMLLFPYARTDGKAKIFMQNINLKIVALATLIALCIAVVGMRVQGVGLLLIAVFSGYIICRSINKKIGGITGDTLGAVNELMEVIVLLGICVLERWGQN